MINNINDALKFIETSHYKTVDQENLKNVLKKHGNFEKTLKCIHVTGTNGKGSTSKMLSDIILNANYKVGLFTSPHMVVANDRIRINNNNISDQELVDLLNYFYTDIINYKLNFFQIYVLLALRYFYNSKVDLAVIEVGIGGRLDSTNVINSIISIITNINYDHTSKLGNSLESIAFEKAGIIKDDSVTITGVIQHNLIDILKVQSDKHKSELIKVKFNEGEIKDNKLVFEFDDQIYSLNNKALYQAYNGQIALMAIKMLISKYNYKISSQAIKAAFDNFNWIGRFEQVAVDPNIILDGAHNIAGIKALINSANSHQKYVVIYSALKDKDYLEMLQLLVDNFKEVVFCEFDFYRGLSSSDVKNLPVKHFSTFDQAKDYLKVTHSGYDIIVCGSLYFISEIRKHIV